MSALSAQRTRSTRCLLIAALVFAADTSAAIYRCAGADGAPRFSQFPCGDGDVVVLEPLHTVRIPPISDAERQRLDLLEQQHRSEREQRARSRAHTARQAEARRDERRERCEAARVARTALERQRRKGYSLSEARSLDRRDAELAAEERHNC
jgi:hypothetical protein